MQTMIYLSGKSDWDLVKLHNVIGHKIFCKMIKEALRVAVRRYYVPKLVPPDISVIKDMNKGKEEPIMLPLYLNPDKDLDVIDALERCINGKKSFFIKQAIRFYLGPTFILGSVLIDMGYNPERTINIGKEFNIKEENKQKIKKELKVKNIESSKKEVKQEDNTNNVSKDESILNKDIEGIETKNPEDDTISNEIVITKEETKENNTIDNVADNDEEDVLSLLSGIIGK